MRTMVDPAATAASRSSLMPIERSSRPRRVGQARHRLEGRGAPPSAGPGAATVMRPTHVELEVAQPRHQVGHLRRGGQPLRPGSPVVSTCTRTEAPGAKRAIRSPSATRATLCQRPTSGASGGHLVALHRAEEVPDRVTGVARRVLTGRLRHELRRVVLARRRVSPAPRAAAHRVGTEALGDADDPHRARDHRRRARSARRTAASLGATSSLAQEGGDVEIVVAQVELFFGCRWRRRRCPPARAWRRSSRPGRSACSWVGTPSSQRSKPAAMTVTRTSSPMLSSITAPKMMLASGWATRVDDLGRLVHLEQPQVGAAGDVEQDAPRALDRGLEQRAT